MEKYLKYKTLYLKAKYGGHSVGRQGIDSYFKSPTSAEYRTLGHDRMPELIEIACRVRYFLNNNSYSEQEKLEKIHTLVSTNQTAFSPATWGPTFNMYVSEDLEQIRKVIDAFLKDKDCENVYKKIVNEYQEKVQEEEKQKKYAKATEAAKLMQIPARVTTQNIGTVHSFHGNPTELKFGSLNKLEAIDTSNGLTTKVIIYLIKNEYYKQIPGGNLLKWNTNKWDYIDAISFGGKNYFAFIKENDNENEVKYKELGAAVGFSLTEVETLKNNYLTQQQPERKNLTQHQPELKIYANGNQYWTQQINGKNCYWWDDPNPNKTDSGWYVIGDTGNKKCS